MVIGKDNGFGDYDGKIALGIVLPFPSFLLFFVSCLYALRDTIGKEFNPDIFFSSLFYPTVLFMG